jgi:hypothetical protein
MSTIRVSAESDIAAPAERVYRILANYRDHHPKVLPPAFSNFAVEEGGIGEGTVIRFNMTTLGRTQSARQRIEEPEPGRVLREVDLDRDMQTTFTVTPKGDGSHLRMDTVWNEGGLMGPVMKVLAPRLLGPIFREELENIDRYAREMAD